MKTILKIMTVISMLVCLACCCVLNAPRLVNFDDSLGFGVIAANLIVPSLTLILWSVYRFLKTADRKVKILSALSLVLCAVFLINFFMDFLHLGGILFVLLPAAFASVVSVIHLALERQKNF